MLDVSVRGLEQRVSGAVLRPGDAGYEEARKVWNGMIDRHPAVIVRCRTAADVGAAVNEAREQGLLLAVRGGGHNVAGNATCDEGMVIDLSSMRRVEVDPERRIARAEGGCTWADVDRATHEHGLATTGGLVSTTGIAGFTLGGGIGWLMRKYGLTCDNLVTADVVTADGRQVRASETENPDLLWGLRGGGGNFGVVTTFEYRLDPVSTVLGGLLLYPADRAREALRFYRDFVAGAPDELTTLAAFITAPPAPFVPAELQHQPAFAVMVCYTGDLEAGEQAVRSLRAFGPPAADVIGPMPYPALQSLLDESAPAGLQNYWKSAYVNDLDDQAVDTLVTQAAAMRSPFSAIHLHHMEGAVRRPPADTAFGHRDGRFAMNIVGMWFDPAESDVHRQWARDCFAAMSPHTTGGVYVNFLGDEGEDRVRAAYAPETYQRLVALKQKYDPGNLFRLNQNIRPDLHEAQ